MPLVAGPLVLRLRRRARFRRLPGNFSTRCLQYVVFLAVTMSLKCTQIVHQIPCVIGLDDIRERRHWRSIHTGHEDPIEIFICRATLKTGVMSPGSEVVRTNGVVLAVGKGSSRWTVASSLLS